MKYLLLLILTLTIIETKGQQTLYDTISHDGLSRSYILYVPQTYTPGEPAPLIINLHGYTSNAFEQMNYGDFREISDTAGFLIVHPQGTVDAFGNTHWNVNWAGAGTVDDVSFIEALIDSLSAEYSINNEQVFSTGMSNGGFMSYKLACELSNRIAAIASVTGSMNVNQTSSCSPQHPMPVMEIHGTADGVVPYNGNFLFETTENTIDYWVNVNQCNSAPVVTQIPNTVLSDSTTVEHYVYASGLNGVEVEHYKIFNGGHTWPGSLFDSGNGYTNQDINASEKIWNFFQQYDINGRIGITGIEKPKTPPLQVKIFPIPAEEFITISWTGEPISTIRILNSLGISVLEQNVAGMNNITLPTQDFSSGMYILQLVGLNNTVLETHKVVF